ncbi:GNAT family N-acetyltransferase [Streptomyces buecherae]|uniref:GNAT family N-acetyltransferase n=1 Tax=Streptomyces buecherae TaxID=2763006 RepID=A0A7H8NH00_9ACTN|nr:GNAT family N-acetyltransferase [Streptomyces buecherae]QKW53769.1 GNAT family N-acetyltransferase [Streptomyces buecherae]
MTPTLRTARMTLTPYRPEDEDAFVGLLRDEEVCRWMGQERAPEADLRAVFKVIMDEIYPQSRFDLWAVWLDGAYVGHAEIKKTGNVDGYEIIAAFVRDSWGKGLGSELARELIRYAARTLGVDRVYGMVGAENAASLALCARLGFTFVRDVVGDDGSVTKMLVVPTGAAPDEAAPKEAAPKEAMDPAEGAPGREPALPPGPQS